MSDPAASCASCGRPVDPLRAPAIRLTTRRAYCFCSPSHADSFSFNRKLRRHFETSARQPASVTQPASSTARPVSERPPRDLAGSTARDLAPDSATAPAAPRADSKLNASADANKKSRRKPRHAGYRTPQAWGLLSLVLAALALVTAWLNESGDPWAPALLLTGLALLQVGGLEASRRMRRTSANALFSLRQRLNGQVRVVMDERIVERPASELRAGEEIQLSDSEVLLVDGVVVSGSARVRPWLQGDEQVTAHPGHRLCAGAQLLDGQLRLICTASGEDRSIGPLLSEGGRRLDRQVEASRHGWRIAAQGAPLLAIAGAALALAARARPDEILAVTAGLLGAFCSPLPGALIRHASRRWLLNAYSRGILYQTSEALDRAGDISTAVYCARGTVLHGEPEVTEIHTVRDYEESHVLSLAAGAESVVDHPVATSVLRAAHERGINPDACRGHHATTGMGVTCTSARGASLVVGSRELLLRQRISVAMAEETLRGLESRGRTGLLIAEESHLIGIVALYDGLRPGSKASVQLLLDAGIEPVLLSGESRQTVEALARALAIEHLRPEVPASQRADEVRSLEAGGALVAAIGTSPRDDGALLASHVPVVLDGATVGARLQGITVLSQRVTTAAHALILARRLRADTLRTLIIAHLPAALGSLVAGSLLLPAYWAPLLAFWGHMAAVIVALRVEPTAEGTTGGPPAGSQPGQSQGSP